MSYCASTLCLFANPYFIMQNEKLRLFQRDIDGAHTDRVHRHFHKDFRVEVRLLPTRVYSQICTHLWVTLDDSLSSWMYKNIWSCLYGCVYLTKYLFWFAAAFRKHQAQKRHQPFGSQRFPCLCFLIRYLSWFLQLDTLLSSKPYDEAFSRFLIRNGGHNVLLLYP